MAFSGTLKNPFNESSNEDDEFGDFTSAVTFPPIDNHENEPKFQTSLLGQSRDNSSNITLPTNSVFFNPIPVDSDNDDEFGDFCGPTVAPTLELSPTSMPVATPTEGAVRLKETNKYQPNYDIDLESDLTAVPQLLWITQEKEEEFTNFSAAEPVKQEWLAVDPPSSNIDSKLFTDPSTQLCAPTTHHPFVAADIFLQSDLMDANLQNLTLPVLHDSKTSADDFGDFTLAVVTNPVEDLLNLVDTSRIDADVTVSSFSLEPSVSSLLVEEEDTRPYSTSTSEMITVESSTPQLNWEGPCESLELIETPQINWDETPVIDSVDNLNEDETIKVFEDDEVDLEQVTDLTLEKNEEFVIDEIATVKTTMVQVSLVEEKELDSVLAQEESDEEFGDFTDFQTACEKVVVETEDDEFDDFEAAPAVCESAISEVSSVEMGSTPENHIQRVLTTLFPVSPNSKWTSEPVNPLTDSPGGTLWSYVSQLDSTPALSFSWRHSAAQQRFLHSLHIDNMLQMGNPAYRWASPASVNSSSSISESFTESTVTLDLDFFLNPSSSTVASAVLAPSNAPSNADSLLETIEREMLSPSNKSRPTTLTSQSPAPVRHSSQLSNIFEHLHLDAGPPPSSTSTTVVTNRQGVVDLLQ